MQASQAETQAIGAVPTAAAMVSDYDWLCIDLETADANPTALERWFRLQWSPTPTWKDETIGKRFRELHARKMERLALLNESPVICISLRSDTELRCLHWLHEHEPQQQHGGLVEGFADAAHMLAAFGALLEQRVGPETTIVGHNIVAFDLPKLRWAFLRNGVTLPAALASRNMQVFDTMREYCRRFTIAKDIMISLDDVCEDFGIQSHKGIVSGDQVGELYQSKRFDLLIAYAMADALLEADLFTWMAGLK